MMFGINEKELYWEEIAKDTERLKVIGGWIVCRSTINGRSQSFVPDKDHKWTL